MIWHWLERHNRERALGAIVADGAAKWIGSWTFIVGQTIITIIWILCNTVFSGWLAEAFDRYPFILLNLFFSLQAFYAAPLILMAQNRQTDRDRIHAQHDFEVNVSAKEEIEQVIQTLARIENEKLDRIIAMVEGR